MQIIVHKINNRFEVHPIGGCGSYLIGAGRTIKEALGDFLITYQTKLLTGEVPIQLDNSAQSAENRRRQQYFKSR